MRLTALILTALSATPAWATTYSIEIEQSSLNAAPIHASLTVNEGQAGSITYEDTTVKFTPTSEAGGAVKIQAEVIRRKDGIERIVARPSVITLPHQAAEISEGRDDGTELFHLKFTPTPVEGSLPK